MYMYIRIFIEKGLKRIVVKMFLAVGIIHKKILLFLFTFCNEHNYFYNISPYIYDYIRIISSIKKILANIKKILANIENNNSYK